MRLGLLCAILWRILTNLVFQETGNFQGPIHPRPTQCGSKTECGRWAIQSGPSQRSSNWYAPGGTNLKKTCFSMRLNNRLLQFVSPVPDPLAWAVDAFSLPWEDQVAIMGKLQPSTVDGYRFKQKHQTPDSPVQGVSLPLNQFSFEKSAGQRGSKQCGSSSYSCPGTNSGQII